MAAAVYSMTMSFDIPLLGRRLPAHLHGWIVSVCVHGAVIAGVMLASPPPSRWADREPFRWEVLLVPADVPVPSPAPSRLQPARRAMPVGSQLLAQAHQELAAVKPQPVERRVETRKVVDSFQREVREIAAPVRSSESVPNYPAAIQEPLPIERKPVVEAEETLPISPASQPSEADVAADPGTAPAGSSAPPVSLPDPQETSGAGRSEVAALPPAPPSVAGLAEAAGGAQPPISAGAGPSGDSRGDYGWLAEMLWRRVSELKRYPASARLNGWEGRVVVQAVIQMDGHLTNVSVLQSSGYEVLDEAAMDAIRLACPLPLKHKLFGRAAVVVQVPISYKLKN